MKKFLLLIVMCAVGMLNTYAQGTFTESFTDGISDSWRVIDADGDGYQWVTTQGSTNGSSGHGILSYTYFTHNLAPDNYIVTTEKYNITEATVLKYWIRAFDSGGTYTSEYYAVVVSEDGENWTNLYEGYHTNNVWSEQTVNFSDYTDYVGKSVHFGFRHFDCDGNSATGLVIDEINLTGLGEGNEGGEGGEEVVPTPAETTFAYNFDDGTFTGWRTFDVESAYCLGWQISPEDPVLGSFYSGTDGTDCAVSVSANPLGSGVYKPNSYLVTENAYQITSTSTLSWNVKAPFAASAEYYEVVVSSDGENFTAIWSKEEAQNTTLEARQADLSSQAGQTLYIGFRHYRETSNSNGGFLCIDDVVLSSEGGGEVEPQAPAAPANLVAEAAGTNSIVLTWYAVAGATKYNIYDEYDVIATTEETTYTVEGLAAATQYCFLVTAVNEVGESFGSNQACATTDEQQGGDTEMAQTLIIGEDGTTTSNSLPTQSYYAYAISQQIYTAADMNNTAGNITKVAFYQKGYGDFSRDFSVYMLNTDKELFEGVQGWATVTNADLVFQGVVAFPGAEQWLEIELQTPFIYTGGNLLLCVVDNTGAYYDNLQFKTFDVDVDYGDDGRGVSIYHFNDYNPYDLNDIAEDGILSPSRNTVQFSIISEPGLSISHKDGIALGVIQLGNYWPEKEEASADVIVSAIERTVTSITCDNDFFVLSEIDLSATPIKFTVGYDKEAAAGEYTGTLTVTAAEGDVLEVPMSATLYDPVEPDVFELAREITFTDNAYSDTPDFTTLHDDYVLPNEPKDNVAPDAVYSFTLDTDYVVKANVTGEGGVYAIYPAESFEEGNGPGATNNSNGEETILETTFSYDFSDASLADFDLQDLDEYQDFCWSVEDGRLVSISFTGWYEGETYNYINKADERIITKEAYTITANSVLTLDMDRYESATFQTVIVEITQDGETFIPVGTLTTVPSYFDEYKDSYSEYYDENGNYITYKRLDIGSLFVAEGLSFGDYRIALHAQNNGAGYLFVDNFEMTERAGVYEAGDYYLVAAAKEAFTVDVELIELGDDEPVIAAPTNLVATANSDTQIILNWDAVENAVKYNVYFEGEYIGEIKDAPSARISNLSANSTYCFTVTAVDAEDNESAHSNEACATTLETPTEVPAAPTNLAWEFTDDDKVRIYWDAVEGATSYNVYIYGLHLGTVSNPAAILTDLEEDVYTVTVTAVNSAGESAHSEELVIDLTDDVAEITTSFNVYPNPVSDVLFIESTTNVEEVTIFTVTGVMVYNEQCADSNVQINVSDFDGGVYIIKIRTANNETINRFIKK